MQSTGDGRAPPSAEAGAARDPKADAPAAGADADLLESLRALGASGRAGLGAAGDTAKALRSLVAADISLARSALGRALALMGVAIAFGGSAWLLLMATLIVFLSRTLGMPWSLALLLSALLSLAVTAWAGWQAVRYFEHTRMQATRRQLARLGIGELADFTPAPGSPESAREATRRWPPDAPGGDAPKKDERGVDLTPP
ncbi:phage holin family protein [Lysobacter silvisoli]|uniref:phage holin family protein n=1 Tax=Lysobacter silvisoli TaxID=2293254 RepID=UPI001E4F5E0C|nr:phage holin family protein [Lysobacter silvisoli]